jgi:hypothetical protein
MRGLTKKLFQEWREILENEAELTLAAVEPEATKQTSQAADLIEHLQSNGFHVMRRAADMQRSSDRQSALELQEFLLSAVATAAHLSPPIIIPFKMHYKRYLKRPNAPAPSTRAKNLNQGLRELMLVLQRLAPDGRILLSGLAYLLSQSAAAGKHLPPQWMQLDKNQSTETRIFFLSLERSKRVTKNILVSNIWLLVLKESFL